MPQKTIAQVVAEGKLKRFMPPRLIKALGHPVREHILAVLNERIASPKEIGQEIGLEVETFYHHFEVLEELDCIERVDSKPRRGATEHYFRAKTSFFVDDSDWSRFPTTVRMDWSADTVRSIFNDAACAIHCGTFDAREDRHASWLPGYLDEQGLQEEIEILAIALACSMAIHSRSAQRLAESGERGTPWTTAVLAFEMPAPAETGQEAATR
jgi:DNA-binding transcriptional ArsR family regulator